MNSVGLDFVAGRGSDSCTGLLAIGHHLHDLHIAKNGAKKKTRKT